MAKDHYVAQTYLRQFLAPSRRLLHGYRKSDGKQFPCRPQDICHELDGDIIPDFAADPAMLGQYRKLFEPGWRSAVREVGKGRVSPSEKLTIAGYWANLLVCTPTWVRLFRESYSHQMLETLRIHQAVAAERGRADPLLAHGLAGLEAGRLKLETEADFIRAMNASRLMRYAGAIYNSDWIIICNDTGTGFLTSDNPVAFHDPGASWNPRPAFRRFLPVSPTLCLSCDLSERPAGEESPDFARPPLGTARFAKITDEGVARINAAVVQCAEDLVLSAAPLPSVAALVAANAEHQVRNEYIKIPMRGETILGMRTRVTAPRDNRVKT